MENENSQRKLCPCSSGKNYHLCYKNYVERKMDAPIALSLIRSRYNTAFTLLNESYLRYSRYPDTCPKNIHLNVITHWPGLKIINTIAGEEEKDTTGEVEFVARSKINGKASRLHERSQFRRVDNRWVYLVDEITAKK